MPSSSDVPQTWEPYAVAADLTANPQARTYTPTWAIIAALAASAACCVSWELTFAAVVGLGLVWAMVRYPAFGMALLVTFFLLQGSPFYEQYGSIASRGATASDLGGLLVLAGLLLQRIGGSADKAALPPQARVLFGVVLSYFGFAIASSFWSFATVPVLTNFIRVELEAPALLLLSILVFNSRSRLRLGLAAYAVTAIVISIYVISHYSSVQASATGPFQLSLAHQIYRGGNIGYDANVLSTLLAVGPALGYLAMDGVGSRWRIAVTVLTLPVNGFALLILSSRGVVVSLAVGVIAAAVISKGGSRTRLTLLALVAVVAGLFFIAEAQGVLPSYFLQRFQTIGTDQASGRGPVWSLALTLFANNPLGLGAMAFERILPSAFVATYAGVDASHSDYIGSLVDLGVVGTFAFVVMLATLTREVVFRGGQRNAAVIVVWTVLLVAMASTNLISSHYFWVVAGLLVCFSLTSSPRCPKTVVPARSGMESNPSTQGA
jgi:hypothetical protein